MKREQTRTGGDGLGWKGAKFSVAEREELCLKVGGEMFRVRRERSVEERIAERVPKML